MKQIKTARRNLTADLVSFLETYYEVVSFIERHRSGYDETAELNRDEYDMILEMQESQGSAGMYSLAKQWASEFEKLNAGRQWDGEFFDEIEKFCNEKNKGR